MIAPSFRARSATVPLRLALVLCASLQAACGGGSSAAPPVDAGGGGSGTGGANEPAAGVTIRGKAQYELPPPRAGCQGLNFNVIETRPIRQATVELIDAASGAVLDAGVTADNGDFVLSAGPETDVFVRVRAELKKTGEPAWDVEVRDNTASGGGGPDVPLPERALYVLDGAAFNSGTSDLRRDITAKTGWDGTAYTATRAAAPFAVLDTVYAGMRLVLAEDPTVLFEPLDVYWSVNNKATGDDQDIDDGEIGTSFYRGDNALFLLGQAGSTGADADEFDDHVIAHEWGHYFEDTFSRSDSIGGAHTPGDLLDMRVAFGEGWATALSGMALGSPRYCDTIGSGGFGINIEGQFTGTRGWFNEVSILTLIYDLWDTAVDGADSGSLGFRPIYDVMRGAEAGTPAFTSIFSFASALKAENPAAAPFIDTLLAAEGITATGIDPYGEGETNDASGDGPPVPDALPVYTIVVPDGSTVNVCSNSQFDRSAFSLKSDGNKLSEHRFLRMSVATPARYRFNITTTTAMPPDDPEFERDQSDPDILIVRNGESVNRFVNGHRQGFSGAANEEIFTTPDALPAGDYVMDLVEYRYQDDRTLPNYPPQTCFDVTVSAAP